MKKQSTSLIPLLCICSKHFSGSRKNWKASIALTFFAAFYSNFGFAQPCTVAPITTTGTGIITTVAGNGSSTFSGDGGPATAAGMAAGPTFSAVDLAGNVYISDNFHLRKITPLGIINTIAGTGVSGNTGDGGPATAATFGQINGVAVDASGNIYIADGVYHRIRKVNPAGVISHFAGSSLGLMGSTGDGGLATTAQFNNPQGIAVDAAGRLYIADLYNNRIRMVDLAGTITAVAGTGVLGTSGDGGPATTARLDHPSTVAVDAAGNIFIAFTSDYRIRKVDASSGIISTIAGTGIIGFSGDGGPATAAQIQTGYGIATDPFGNVYYSDYGSRRVRKIDGAGIITTIAGTGSAGYSGDGVPATVATIDGPMGINYYGGDLYLAEQVNHRVRKINAASPFSLCEGSSLQLSDPTPGGTWSSSSAVAAVDAIGLVMGIVAGTSTITYQMSPTCFATAVVTVNSYPGAILGAPYVCVGSTTSLANVSTGGTWSSGNPSVAMIGSFTGVVLGVSPGTSAISYTLPTGCAATTILTVNPIPNAIAGLISVCVGAMSTLTSASIGGTWSSNDLSIAGIDMSTGVLTGNSPGITTISYTLPTGCYTTTSVIVNAGPAPIAGTTSICSGSTSTLTDAVTGGTWSSSDGSIVVISSITGVATGISAGTAIISYTLSTGCTATTVVTVNPLPSITGSTPVCVGSSITLGASPAGGFFTSLPPSIATVDPISGVVTGISAGVANISYTLATGCFASAAVTVNPVPGPITGALSICTATTSTLSGTPGPGLWTSSNTSVATIGIASGVLSGVSAGTATITYRNAGCETYAIATVSASPGAITGSATLCAGSTTTLASTPSGGTWASSNTAVGTIDVATGVLTGIASGTTRITYAMGAGCFVTRVATVNTTPTINPTSATTICLGGTAALTGSPFGGTWVSSNTSVATVSAGGLVSSVAVGTTTITYTITATGCRSTKVVTVNAMPTAITPATPTVCVGNTLTMGNSVAGGVWTSGNLAVGTISATGVATGLTAGTARITYAIGTCSVTTTLTVNSTPTINPTAATSLCVGDLFSVTGSLPGGTWSSSNIPVASVSSGGVITAISSGTATISYTMATGCFGTKVVTVNTAPAAITPSSPTVCENSTITLSNSVTGGSWTSSNPTIAVIGSATGLTSGIAPGTSLVTYAIGSCSVVTTVTVNAVPASISGSLMLCAGSATTLSSTPAGGTWSSSDVVVGTVDGAGVVTGISAGTTTITYMLGTGCSSIVTATINAGPAAIMPSSPAVCVGSTTTLSNSVSGGMWASSDPVIAAIGSTDGVVTGLSTGTAFITYAIGACTAVTIISVNAAPAPITPSSPTVCIGSTVTLVNAVMGGTWGSSNPAVASVDMFTGVVTGIFMGAAEITYTLPTGCYVTVTATINSAPTVIIPTSPTVCEGSSIFLSNSVVGGTWASDNVAVAIVDGAGNVTGLVVGTSEITYAIGSCIATTIVTVNAGPTAILPSAPIVCAGASITLADAIMGGMWTSSDATVATVGSTTGVLTGAATGTTMVSYTVGGCTATVVATVSSATTAGFITGPSILCMGSPATYADGVPGGVWSTNTGNATIASSGVASGVSAGTDIISYTISNTCGTVTATMNVSINATPSAGTILGPSSVCAGSSISMSSTVAGGVWSSSDNTFATAGASGLIAGVSAGTVIISYSFTDATGCTGIATAIVTVNALPTVSVITGTPAVCVGGTTTLGNATPGGVWTSSATGTATVSSSGVVAGVASGTSVISYSVTDGFGCTGMATVISTVNLTPAASPITGTMAVCAGSNTALFNAVPGGVWSSSSLSVGTVGISGVVTGMGAGTATISYVVSNSCGSVTNTAIVTVNVLPIVAPITSSLTTLCIGATGTVSNSTPGGVWSSSNPSVATVSPAGLVTGILAGTVNITYTVTNIAGCSGFAIYTLAVAPGFGSLAVMPTPGATMCDSASVYMYVTPPTPGLTYQWRIAGVDMPGATSDGYTATSPGGYSVMVGNGMCSMVLAGPTVSVAPSPTIGFNPPGQLFTGSFAGYQWYLNGVAIPGATTSVLNFTGDGAYTVKVFDVNGCGVMSQPHDVKTTGTPAIVGIQDINVYPNPATSILYIDAAMKVNASVLAMDGKTIMTRNDATSLNISKLPAGMYMIMIYDESNLLLKVVKFAKVD